MPVNYEKEDKVPDDNHEKEKLHRRNFLKKSGVAVASAVVLASSLSACAPTPHTRRKSIPNKRLAMVIDLRKCYGCHSCSIACKSEFNVPLGVRRSRVETTDKGTYPEVKRSFLPRLCNNCANPSCVSICPTKPHTGMMKKALSTSMRNCALAAISAFQPVPMVLDSHIL